MLNLKKIINDIRVRYFIWKSQHFQRVDKDQGPIGSLGIVFESKDEVGQFILQNIAQPPVDLFVGTVCFRGDKKLEADYMRRIFNIAESLLKANDHRRKYLEIEKELLKKFRKNSLKDPNKHIDLTLDPIELNNEIDACLSQLKAALDSSAGILTPLFGFGIDAWRKEIKGNKIKKNTGYKIVEAFKNAPKPLNIDSVNLQDYLIKNGGWLTYLSMLRDMPIHGGGLQNISPLIFDHLKKDVLPQKIHHSKDQVEEVGIFLTRTVTELSQFISNFILATINLKGFGLIPFRKDSDNPPKYYWGTSDLIKAEKEKAIDL